MAQKRQQAIGFKSVQLLKDETLGIGSYGKVCKAKCDDLLCAAKLIHETLFDPTAQQQIAPQREHRLPMRRFEQECEFLSTIRHPNIVQYLGIYQDPDTGLPGLLMELMDESLTHFLESSPQPIPYHIQVNVCHDITLALSFLHSNGIIHRDLSSNNVLLIGNVRAKVTDFGMARLGDQNPRATQLTFTMCPGTDVYMPPEAVQDKPVYTEKIDCFSFGVIIVQSLTQEFPKPGDRRKRIEIDHSGLPKGTFIEARISEVKRRQNHIGKIDSNHTLLPIALDCLKDEDVERPSAQQLCGRVAALKEETQYSESVREVEARSTAEQGRSDEREREQRALRQQHSQQVHHLQKIIQSQSSQLDENTKALRQKEETIATAQQKLSQLLTENCRLEKEKNQEREKFERQLGRVNHQLEESEQVINQFQRRIAELEQLRPATDTTPRSKEQQSSSRVNIKLTWRKGAERAPCKIATVYNAAVGIHTLYMRNFDKKVYAYTVSNSTWSQLPHTPTINCPLVIINGLLTLVGGELSDGSVTNQLFSLTGGGSSRRWTKELPAMPTKRKGSIALCAGTVLVVAGGVASSKVEILNTATFTKQWSTAVELPQPLSFPRGALCGGHVYILGATNMYTCSLGVLTQSGKSFLASIRNRGVTVWKEVAAPPVTLTTCVSVRGQLLAIGGKDSDKKPTTAVHMYNPTIDSWEVISRMRTPRQQCIAGVLPDNQLMVVGGYTNTSETDSEEFAAIE